MEQVTTERLSRISSINEVACIRENKTKKPKKVDNNAASAEFAVI
jgi:hypothetical protein